MVEPGRARRRRKWILWVLVSAVAIIAAPYILISAYYGVASLFAGCSEAEEAALTEFPHYGGIIPEPDGDVESGGCRADLTVDDPPGDVIAYYREQLTEHGWTLVESEQPEGETSEGEVAFEAGGISAQRDGLFYHVIYEAVEGRTITLVVSVIEV